MEKDKSVFHIPSYARPEAYAFVAPEPKNNLYQELSAISEEILKCRSKILPNN